MSFFNPFKKKDNEFKLNDSELPSLKDSGPSLGNDPSLNSGPKIPSLSDSNSFSNSGAPSLSDMSKPDFNPSDSSKLFEDTEPLPKPVPSMSGELPKPTPVGGSSGGESLHEQISRSKLEAIDSKVNLMDARLNAIEQKVEMIYQMVASEISDDTRRKLSVDSMMDSVRKK